MPFGSDPETCFCGSDPNAGHLPLLLMVQKSQGQPPFECRKPVGNHGIVNYQNVQLVSLPDFWSINTMTQIPQKLDFCFFLVFGWCEDLLVFDFSSWKSWGPLSGAPNKNRWNMERYHAVNGNFLKDGTQQPWVFLLNMIILGCFGTTTI